MTHPTYPATGATVMSGDYPRYFAILATLSADDRDVIHRYCVYQFHAGRLFSWSITVALVCACASTVANAFLFSRLLTEAPTCVQDMP